MRCPNCGQRLSDSVVKCQSCGLIFTEEDRLLMNEEEQEQENFLEENPEESGPQRQEEQTWQAAPAGRPVKRGLFDDGLPETEPFHGRMKWYWFIVHIQLLLSTLSFLLNGYMYLTGAFYGDQAAVLYETYPAMSLLDKGFGIFAIVMAGLAIFTRTKLKAYREGAPKQLIMLYILSLLGTVVYIGVEMAIVGQNLITSDLVMSIMISLFMIFVNIYYFRNRRHLFHN